MSKNKKTTFVTAATLATTVFLSGCGLFGGEEKKKIDPPQDASYIEESEADVRTIIEVAADSPEVNLTSDELEKAKELAVEEWRNVKTPSEV